jgi:hypothetical protein
MIKTNTLAELAANKDEIQKCLLLINDLPDDSPHKAYFVKLAATLSHLLPHVEPVNHAVSLLEKAIYDTSTHINTAYMDPDFAVMLIYRSASVKMVGSKAWLPAFSIQLRYLACVDHMTISFIADEKKEKKENDDDALYVEPGLGDMWVKGNRNWNVMLAVHKRLRDPRQCLGLFTDREYPFDPHRVSGHEMPIERLQPCRCKSSGTKCCWHCVCADYSPDWSLNKVMVVGTSIDRSVHMTASQVTS